MTSTITDTVLPSTRSSDSASGVVASHLLIVGASGLVGSAVLSLFTQLPQWRVTTASRRKPDISDLSNTTFHHLTVDLQSAASCQQQLSQLHTITHVMYAALYEKPGLLAGWTDPEQMKINLHMLDNVMTALIAGNNPLLHVTVIHGGKAYGMHVGRNPPIPLRERDADRTHPNFYWLQESLIQRLSKQHKFHYTIFWPMVIAGAQIAVNMNPIALIGVYAAIRREEGLPLSYPGGSALCITQMTDSRLLAKACLHAAISPAAWDTEFNIINGDPLEFRSAWPAIARATGVEVGADATIELADYIKSRGDVWKRVVAKHQLNATDDVLAYLGESLYYGPVLFGETPRPLLLTGHKFAQTGFTDTVDTEESLVFWFHKMQQKKLLPPA